MNIKKHDKFSLMCNPEGKDIKVKGNLLRSLAL